MPGYSGTKRSPKPTAVRFGKTGRAVNIPTETVARARRSGGRLEEDAGERQPIRKQSQQDRSRGRVRPGGSLAYNKPKLMKARNVAPPVRPRVSIKAKAVTTRTSRPAASTTRIAARSPNRGTRY